MKLRLHIGSAMRQDGDDGEPSFGDTQIFAAHLCLGMNNLLQRPDVGFCSVPYVGGALSQRLTGRFFLLGGRAPC